MIVAIMGPTATSKGALTFGAPAMLPVHPKVGMNVVCCGEIAESHAWQGNRPTVPLAWKGANIASSPLTWRSKVSRMPKLAVPAIGQFPLVKASLRNLLSQPSRRFLLQLALAALVLCF